MQTLNQYFLRRATIVYILALLACFVIYVKHWMPWYWYFTGLLEVTLFYVLSNYFQREWRRVPPASFERNVFWVALWIRLFWILGYYLFTTSVWNTPWEQPIGTSMDSEVYYDVGKWINELIKSRELSSYFAYLQMMGHYSDSGYPLLLGVSRFIIGDSIVLTRVPNAFFDAWTTVLVYKIAKNNFNESTGRLASYFAILMPMMIFYTGVTMKESLMLMLITWAIERGDVVIREKDYKGLSLASFIILSFSVSLFRTAITWVLILAFICALVLSSERVLNQSRRVIVLIIVVFGAFFFLEGIIMEQGEELIEQFESTGQNFENRAAREGGNTLVSNLSKAMFFPILFTLPFPTMVTVEGQHIQLIQNGGYFLKNILSFFCIFALVLMVLRGEWRNNVLILAYLGGYLIVLGLSSFAQSGRFHHPAIPIELILSAYGIGLIKNKKEAKLFDYFLAFEFLVIVLWNGFKLKGRGLL